MAKCNESWISDPRRACDAIAIPGYNACLAHTDPNSRREFLASAHEIPESMNGLLINLEIDAGLQEEITGILPKLASIDFRGSEFIETCWLDVHFSGDVDFSSCRFRKRAYFEGVFPRRAYFTYAIFDDAVSFNGARFEDDARFDLATFSSYETFGSDFRAEVWFDRTTFKSWTPAGRFLRCRCSTTTLIPSISSLHRFPRASFNHSAPDQSIYIHVNDPASPKLGSVRLKPWPKANIKDSGGLFLFT